jgi:hypothetical protein
MTKQELLKHLLLDHSEAVYYDSRTTKARLAAWHAEEHAGHPDCGHEHDE